MPTTQPTTRPEVIVTSEKGLRKFTVTPRGGLVVETAEGEVAWNMLGGSLTPSGRMVLVQALLQHEVVHLEQVEGAVEQTVEAINTLLRTLPFGSFQAVRDITRDIRGNGIADTVHIEAVPNNARSHGVVEKHHVEGRPGSIDAVPPARQRDADGGQPALGVADVTAPLGHRLFISRTPGRDTVVSVGGRAVSLDPVTLHAVGTWIGERLGRLANDPSHVETTEQETPMHPADAAAVANDQALWNSAREIVGEQATPTEVLEVAKWLERRITDGRA